MVEVVRTYYDWGRRKNPNVSQKVGCNFEKKSPEIEFLVKRVEV
jgi:hypothetical protein